MYNITICKHCQHQVVWDRRGRGPNDFGWYCRNGRAEGHPELWYGYCGPDDVEKIKVIPRTVADELADKLTLALRTATTANAKVNGEQALTKYREAIGQEESPHR